MRTIRFITKPEVEKLGLGHLLGTAMLRAYMHGYFIDNRLYNRAKAIAQPFAYETYRADRIEKKLAEERKSRISVVRKLPKVCGCIWAVTFSAVLLSDAQQRPACSWCHVFIAVYMWADGFLCNEALISVDLHCSHEQLRCRKSVISRACNWSR